MFISVGVIVVILLVVIAITLLRRSKV